MKSRNSGIHKGSWALLASRESKANGIPRKNPQHRTGSLACCCFLPARGNRAMAEPWLWFRYAIQQPLTVTQKGQRAGLSQEGKRGFNKFGEERKGILEGRTDQGPPIINLPKLQPDPWINSVILQGHWPLLHYQYVTIQCKAMNNTLHLSGLTLM